MRARLIAGLGRPRTLVVAASLIVVIAIGANALFLQAHQHPSPLISTRGSEHAAQAGDPLVRSVQDALTQAGYYSGPLDGIAGPRTQAAIASFEAKTGRQRTGEASLTLLEAIRSAAAGNLAQTLPTPVPSAPVPAPAPAPATAAPDERVAAVQKALALSAYGPLRTDGVFGPETRDAIMRFQRDHHLPVTGALSDALMVELRAAGAMRDG